MQERRKDVENPPMTTISISAKRALEGQGHARMFNIQNVIPARLQHKFPHRPLLIIQCILKSANLSSQSVIVGLRFSTVPVLGP